jgi:uncharacterized damage-inducible protein DinB
MTPPYHSLTIDMCDRYVRRETSHRLHARITFVEFSQTDTAMDLASTFIELSRHYLATEYRMKLRVAVESLPADALWSRPNEESNSVGNLLLHLAGNVRQWIVAGVGGASDTRNRASEFDARNGADAATLLAALDAVLDDADAVLAELTGVDLATTRTIQGRDVEVLEAVFHVVEHFSGHVGQIVLIAKMHSPGAIRFYEDAGGLARPIWPSFK